MSKEKAMSKPLPRKVDELILTATGTSKVLILARYSTGADKTSPETMDDDLIPFEEKKADDHLCLKIMMMNKIRYLTRTAKTKFRLEKH